MKIRYVLSRQEPQCGSMIMQIVFVHGWINVGAVAKGKIQNIAT